MPRSGLDIGSGACLLSVFYLSSFGRMSWPRWLKEKRLR